MENTTGIGNIQREIQMWKILLARSSRWSVSHRILVTMSKPKLSLLDDRQTSQFDFLPFAEPCRFTLEGQSKRSVLQLKLIHPSNPGVLPPLYLNSQPTKRTTGHQYLSYPARNFALALTPLEPSFGAGK